MFYSAISDHSLGLLQVDQEVTMSTVSSIWLAVGSNFNLASVGIIRDSVKVNRDWLRSTNSDLISSYGSCPMQQETCSERVELFHFL